MTKARPSRRLPASAPKKKLSAGVEYSISWHDPNEHLFDVEIRFTARGGRTEMQLPTWRPGRYLIQNYAANVRQWWARSETGGSLEVEKSGKSSWLIESRKGQRVHFGYRYYAGTLDAGSSFLDDLEAWFNGSNLFMMIVGLRSAPVSLSIHPPGEGRIETQLRRQGDGSFSARDWDHLIDSPTIVSRSLKVHQFRESGCDVSMVFQNAEGLDTGQYVDPVRAIVAYQGKLFGGIPTDEYRFLYHAGDRWHGVEHEDSCSIIAKRTELAGAKKGDEGYDHFLAISSHEFFHLWNVKRIMPARFIPYDFTTETPTRLLWVMEGITSYFGERTLLEAGLWTAERYLEHLAREIETLENIPGRHFLSLSQASFDGWLQEPWQMHDKANGWISFYNKGEIVGALLDLEIRRASGGDKRLDDVMRDLWKRYGRTGKGMEENAMEKAVARIAGRDMGEFFRSFVDGTEPLPYRASFARAGVGFSIESDDTPSLGMSLRTSDGRCLIDSVRAGGSSARAGMLPGDELFSIDGMRIEDAASFKTMLGRLGGGTEIAIRFARSGFTREQRMSVDESSRHLVSLRLLDRPTPRQRRERESWLGKLNPGK